MAKVDSRRERERGSKFRGQKAKVKWKKEKREGEEEKRELRKGQSHGEKRRRKEDSLWKIVKKKMVREARSRRSCGGFTAGAVKED